MRFHSVEAIALDIPLTRNFGGSTYAVLKRSTVVTRLRTDDGLVSEVYNGDNREHGPEIVRLIHDELAPLLRGQDLFEGERHLGSPLRPHPQQPRSQDPDGGHRVRGLRDLGPGRQGARPERVRAARRPRRPGACPSSRSAATTARARPSPTSAARWRATARPAWRAASSRWAASPRRPTPSGSPRPAAPRAPTSSWRWTPTAAGRWRTRCASRASSSRSTSAGSRSPATGTTTPV